MKNLFLLISAALILSCSVSKKPVMPQFEPNKVVAHRGAFKKNGLPENSIAALKEAIRLKCTGSEFDVHMSADDSLVIFHDAHINNLNIPKTSFRVLRDQKLSNGEPLPTLREYLQEGLKQNHTRLVLEIKPTSLGKERAQFVARKVVEMVKEMNASPMIVYISFDYDMLKEIVRLDPKAQTQYLNGDKSPKEVKADGITGIDYNFSVFKKKPEWIKEAKENNIILNAWTVNSMDDCKWLLNEGFDFITTNEPEMLLELTK
jgi:glycerophosphoryl diester phosphodiesterase